jgi:hypothetical protein
MFRKSGGPYIIKTHQLPVQHLARATALQASGVAVHLSAALAHPVLQRLASQTESKRLLADAQGRLGLGYGTFVVGELLVCHHPQYGVTLWGDTREVLGAHLHVAAPPAVPAVAPAPAPAAPAPAAPAPAAAPAAVAAPMRYTLTCPGRTWTWCALGAPQADTHHYFQLQDLAYLADITTPWVVEVIGEEGCGARQLVGALACLHGWNVLDTDVDPKHWPPLPGGAPTVAIVRPEFPRQYMPHMTVFVLTTAQRRVPAQHTVRLEATAKSGVSIEQLFGCPTEHQQRIQPLAPSSYTSMYD